MTGLNTTAQSILEALKGKKEPQPYDTQATVVRVDGDTLYVHIPGGVDETPVQRTIDAKEGDTVQIRVSGGAAWAVGNVTAPPTDDSKANQAIDRVDNITLRVVGENGSVSEIKLNDQGQINLLGSVIAEQLNVDELFARDILATGTFQVNNDKISLIADDNGVRITPQSWQSTEFQASLGLHRTYTILTGSVTQVQGTSQIDVNSEGLLNLSGSLGVTLSGGTSSPSIGIQMQSDTKPVITNTFSLGDSSTRWKYIYLNNSPNVSSDRNLKTDILDSVPDIVDNLIPVSYRLKDDESGRIHYGFIAQDVENALLANGIDTDNIGLVRNENGYSLSYDELIPLLVAKIQNQQEQIDKLTERLDRIERMIP